MTNWETVNANPILEVLPKIERSSLEEIARTAIESLAYLQQFEYTEQAEEAIETLKDILEEIQNYSF